MQYKDFSESEKHNMTHERCEKKLTRLKDILCERTVSQQSSLQVNLI